jgi:hypothetical protein
MRMRKDQSWPKLTAVPRGHGHPHNPISKAQKVKGILNVFGVYDHTNEQMYTFL